MVKTNNWQKDILKPLSIKQFGRSYDEKLKNSVKAMGGSEEDVRGFKDFMDTMNLKKSQKVQKPKQGSTLEQWDAESDQEAAARKAQQEKAKKKKAEQQKSQHKKSFTTKKDDQNIFEKTINTINSPLKTFDKKVYQPLEKKAHRFAASFVDGEVLGQFKKNALTGGKALGLEAPKFVQEAVSKPKSKTDKVIDTIGEFAGMAAPISTSYKVTSPIIKPLAKVLPEAGKLGVASKIGQTALRGGLGMGAYGTAREGVDEILHPNDANFAERTKSVRNDVLAGALLDPAFSVGGALAKKGIETASNKAMKNMLPKSEQVQNGLDELVKTKKAETALPIPKKNLFDNLLPTANDLSNKHKFLSLNPKESTIIPKIGKPNELPQINDLSLAERVQMLNGKREIPDFSTAKPVIEQPSNVNVYGVEMPKGDFVDTAPPEYWQKRYEDFAKYVKDNGYNENNLSQESINELWSHFAKPDEPSLNAVVDLAYKGYNGSKTIDAKKVWNRFGNRPPVSQNAKKIIGIDGNGQLKPLKNQSLPNKDSLPVMTIKKTIYKPPHPVNKPKEIPIVGQTTQTHLQPNQVLKQPNERSFYSTVQNPDKLSPELKAKLDEFDKTYKPMSNQELVDYANKYVKRDIEKAYQFVKNANKFDSRHITVGHRLIDELQKSGQYDRALDVVERLAEQGTKAGQSIQSYSIYNRLTAEGQLLRAQRHINKINQTITDPAKQVKLTEQNIQDITHTADSIQKFAGQMEQASNVINIMENVKKGNKATDAELETVRSFVSDAKKFFGDLAPNVTAPKVKSVKDVRTRDKVVDFMSKKEDVARKELQKIFGRANSLPVDAFYHLSVIGASKIAKGTVKLADFTEEMAKEFGDVIRPYAKQIYNKAVETFNIQSESMTRQRLSEVEKITNKALKDKNLSLDEVETIKEFARKVGQLSGDAKLESSMELQSVLQALEVPTFGQKLSTAQTIAQLLNPKTIVRNAIGNELFYRVEQMNKLLATPIDIARSKITGGERTITFISNNQGQYWKNWLSGAKAGWKGVNPMGLQTQYDLGPQAFRSKWNPLTYFEKSLGATLRSFDHAGYMRAYNNTLGELASLRAMNEGLTGQAKKEAIFRYIREADENMIKIADEYGKYATFQDNTVISNALTKVKRGMNKVSTLGTTEHFGLGDLILKYPKTPGNLIMRAVEYSPAGVVRSASLLKTMAKTKDPAATREFWLSFSRAITGTTGFSIMGYFLANKGILTSSGNSDYEIANLEKMAGKQPNSVNVSALKRFVLSGFDPKKATVKKGDTFISYDWAQPISMAVALGTGVSQSQKENGKLGVVDSAKGAFDSAANTIIQSSVLKGLNDFLANYPGRTMSDRFSDAAKSSVGSFVPTLFNQVKQVNDNTARTTYDPSFGKEVLNRSINRIPGLDSKLPPSYDTLGNKRQTYQDGSNNLLNVFLNPSFVSQYNPSPEAKFILDYINQTGDKTAAPRMPDKKLDGIALSGKQYSDLQKIQGQETLKQLKEILPSLKGTNDVEAIHKEIYKILNDAGKKGRSSIREKLVTQSQFDEANKKYGLDKETILHRINVQGWTVQKALTTPE